MTDKKNMHVKLVSMLGFIFFFSGFSALIYQVVWQRLLTLYYGVGILSITIIVSVYMFGLGVGGLLGGFLAERVKNKLLLYFFVELLLGVFGLVSLPFIGYLGRHTAGYSYIFSLICIFLFLCLPTLLMGITFPLLVKIFNRLVCNFLNTVSYLYFINTLGAALGAIFASYLAISFFGLDSAIYIAAAINFAMALLIFISAFFPELDKEPKYEVKQETESILGKQAYTFVFITGFLAIGYEIIWFRFLGVLVKASPYVFSTVLSVYLFGIALGSHGMNKYLQKNKIAKKKSLFFLLQFFVGISVVGIFSGYYHLTKSTSFGLVTEASFLKVLHPYPSPPSFTSISQLFFDICSLFDVLLWPLLFVLIPATCMGAGFPLISFLALSKADKEGETVGTVYFFNTLGNVLGGAITGFLILPYLGTENALLAFSVVNILLGLFVSSIGSKRLPTALKAAIVVVSLIVSIKIFPRKGELYRVIHPPTAKIKELFNIKDNKPMKLYLNEGIDGVIASYSRGDWLWTYINGLAHGGRPLYIFAVETIEALKYTQSPKNVLIIGYGTGTITETILRMKSVESITLVELNKTLIENLRNMEIFRTMLADKRINLIIEDGRRFLLQTQKKFDMILMDPLRSTTAYSNNLYSHEFFKLANNHLNNNGIFLLWMSENKTLPKTVASAFDYMRFYTLLPNNYLCLASNSVFKKDEKRIADLMEALPGEEKKHITAFLNSIQYEGDKEYIQKTAEHYPINKDWKPVCEYYIHMKELPPNTFY